MKLRLLTFALFASVALAIPLRAADGEAALFNEKILPVLKMHCFECHSKGAEEIKGGLRLDTREKLRAGGNTGPIIKPGEPEDSLLIQVLRYAEDDRQMPPRGKLDQEIIDAFAAWVKAGAVDPRGD